MKKVQTIQAFTQQVIYTIQHYHNACNSDVSSQHLDIVTNSRCLSEAMSIFEISYSNLVQGYVFILYIQIMNGHN